MENRSGLLHAGTILLLVGALLQALGVFFLAIYAAVVGALLDRLASKATSVDLGGLGVLLIILMVILAVVVAAGAVLTFLAYVRAKRGDTEGAFLRGLVGSLLPPLNPFALIGAILVKVSPEGERRPAPPPA